MFYQIHHKIFHISSLQDNADMGSLYFYTFYHSVVVQNLPYTVRMLNIPYISCPFLILPDTAIRRIYVLHSDILVASQYSRKHPVHAVIEASQTDTKIKSIRSLAISVMFIVIFLPVKLDSVPSARYGQSLDDISE